MSDKNIVHISTTLRSEGDSTGVPKFACYLQRAIGCELIKTSQVQQAVQSGKINKQTIKTIHARFLESSSNFD